MFVVEDEDGVALEGGELGAARIVVVVVVVMWPPGDLAFTYVSACLCDKFQTDRLCKSIKLFCITLGMRCGSSRASWALILVPIC